MPWERAWQEALYGPDGFYRNATGPAAHFATSAQGIPHGTQVLAQAVLAMARRERLTRVVDLAAGRGELATALADLAPDLDITAADVVARPTGLAERVGWLVSPGGAALPPSLTGLRRTLLLAHEWLDVVPCPVVQRVDGVWRVVRVDPTTGTESLGGEPSPQESAWIATWLPAEVRRAEIGLPRDRAMIDVASRVDTGLVVAVDYGHTAADRPREGTLTAYRHGRQVRPVADGTVDLTAHVAVDSLLAAVGSSARAGRQREVLTDLLGPPTHPPHDLARTRPTAYLEQLARQGAHRTLTAHGGLGDFWWVLVPRGD